MKIRPVGAELLHAGGRTDKVTLKAAFRNFVNAPTMDWKLFNKHCMFLCFVDRAS